MYKEHAWRKLAGTPRVTLAVTLVAGLILALLPRRAIEPLATLYAACVDPGRTAAAHVRDLGTQVVARVQESSATADDVTQLADEVRRLRARNRELETALAVASSRSSQRDCSLAASEAPPLLLASAIRGRVLGRRACAVLSATHIVAVGARAGAERESLALVDSTIGLDLGQDNGLTAGDITLEGRRVFGKICDVGPYTSGIRRADQAGYRDVVQLARKIDGTLQFGPRGILEGSGEHHGRVRLVSASETIEPGNLVFTAGHEGLAQQPLLYGVVARAEHRGGAPHWDIWVDLAAGGDEPSHLVVLRAGVNPDRLVATQSEFVPGRNDE
ncbi:MAG TPA: rod shape-determining protein MreC [Pirellulales bacterium]|jgi:cell shape-determining protein MreC